MGDCPKCGVADPGVVDFCPNPQCRTYLGWASAAAPPRPNGQRPPPGTQAVSPHQPGDPPAGPRQKRGVRVTIEPTELTVDPGGAVTTTVTVRNLGTRVEEFRLTPHGPATAFAAITPATLSIYPDDRRQATVRFTPPRDPQSPADVARFEIVARSEIHPDVSDAANGQLTITPFHELSAVLTPEVSRGRTPSRHQVRVTNGGNTPVNGQLTFRDQDAELTFKPPAAGAMLQPGAVMDVPVLVNGPRRWFGRTERRPFTAVVTPTGPQPPITLHGTRCQTAVFPWWVPTTAFAVVAITIALLALLKPGMPTVPVIGEVDETTAVALLTDARYLPDVIKAGHDGVAAGLTIRTDPEGGTELKHGERVKLYLSTGKCPDGPCPVEVPNVKGLPVSEAQAKLQRMKFVVRSYRVPDDLPADQVVASDPAAATLHPPGTEVALTVSSGPQGSSPSPVPLSAGPPGPPPENPPQGLPVPLPGLPVPLPGQPVQPSPDNSLPQTTVAGTPPPTTPPPTPPPPAEKCSPTPSADRPADGLTIDSPGTGDTVGGWNEASGTARLAPDKSLWLLLCAPILGGFYIESEEPVSAPGGTWKQGFGLDTSYPGDYKLYAVIVNAGQDPYELIEQDGNGTEFGRQLPRNAHYVYVDVTLPAA